MKKVLMGTTALVALGAWAVSPAAAEEEKIKINVGGYYMTALSYTDQNFDNPALNFHADRVRQEGEIHFTGETTLDNNLTVGVNVQLEAFTTADQVDEHFVYFSGAFGKVIIGSENAPSYLMGTNAPGVGLGVNSPTFLPFAFATAPTGNAAPTSTYVTGSGDNNKISFFSMRYSGFQFGVGYTPNSDAGGGSSQTGGLSADGTPGQQANTIGVGVNFVNSFNGFDVGLNGTYEIGSLEAQNIALNADDRQQWQVGATVGFAGFSIGGSYGTDNNGLSGNNDDRSWDVGVSYGMGPWGVSLSYLHGEQEMGAVTQDDELDYFELGASYALGPGIKVFGGIQVIDLDSATVNNRSDGVAATIATKLSF